jgi:MULE transposase domain
MAVTAIGRTTSICFLPTENELAYRQAIQDFKDLVMGDVKIDVFFTDDETALKTALSDIFPGVPQLLCLWHIMNIKTKAQKRSLLRIWGSVLFLSLISFFRESPYPQRIAYSLTASSASASDVYSS